MDARNDDVINQVAAGKGVILSGSATRLRIRHSHLAHEVSRKTRWQSREWWTRRFGQRVWIEDAKTWPERGIADADGMARASESASIDCLEGELQLRTASIPTLSPHYTPLASSTSAWTSLVILQELHIARHG
jgi:hypothetical protein